MKLGVVYPQSETGGDPAYIRTIGLAAEEIGFDHLLVYDHVLGACHDRDPPLNGPYDEEDSFHDPFVLFSYLAGITKTLEFATGILVLPQRQTALVARQAADVDLISEERLRLGVGVGWNHVEYEALGQDFGTRGRREDEQIDLLRRLWSEPLLTFVGKFDEMRGVALNPRPRRPIPIWVGGFSEKAYARGAAMGDGFIFFGSAESCIAARKRVLELRNQKKGTVEDFGTELIVSGQTPDEVAREIERWEGAGGTHAAVRTRDLGFTTPEAHIEFASQVRRRVEGR